MAVTIKIDDKKRVAAKTAPDAPPPAQLDDYVLQSEKQEGWKALGIWVGLMTVIVGPWWIREETQPIAYGMTMWWLFSTFAYFFVAPFLIARRLRVQGESVNSTNQPRLKALLQKGSGVLGINEPETFLEAEGKPQVLTFPRYLVVRKGALTLMEPDELNCLAVRGLVHLRQGHARRLSILHLLDHTEPIVRVLVWPVVLYGKMLRTFWLQPAHINADRLALLLIKNHRLMIAAILKEHAASDPEMQEMEVSTADVTAFIQQAGYIGMEGKEISTQYKLGRAIHENPILEERLQGLSKWADSAEFKTATQKLAEARSKK